MIQNNFSRLWDICVQYCVETGSWLVYFNLHERYERGLLKYLNTFQNLRQSQYFTFSYEILIFSH